MRTSWPASPFRPAAPTEVWYMKPSYWRTGSMGHKFAKEHGGLPSVENLGATHELLGTVPEVNPEKVFMMMQGEFWSPEGEARELISSLGLHHTSMSVGDVVVTNGVAHMVDRFGFVPLNEE